MPEQRWHVAAPAPGPFLRSVSRFGPPQLLHILWHRGIRDANAVADFFAPPDLTQLPDPMRFTDMEAAVLRFVRARERGETVLIYGDCDPDGACGAVILKELCDAFGVPSVVYLPDRVAEGHAMSDAAVRKAIDSGFGLCMTVDLGVSEVEAIGKLRDAGIDTIVFDHHQVPPVLPPAAAIVDAHREADSYPFKDLCGTGVAFAFAQAVMAHPIGTDAPEGLLTQFLDCVALATVADLVPVVGPNRVLLSLGIARLRETPRIGLSALIDVARLLPQHVDEDAIAFELAPRVNAAARVDHIDTAFALLTATDRSAARKFANELDRHNRDRQRQVAAIVNEAVADIDAMDQLPDIIVLAKPSWSPVMLGMAANRLIDRYHRPTFLFSVRDGVARGSGRSVPGFDLVRAMRSCGGSNLFMDFGGHPMAAGCSLREDWLPLFRERAEAFAREHMTDAMRTPTLSIDLELRPHELSAELLEWFEKLRPFGKGNPRPLLLVRDLTVLEARAVGRGEKRLTLRLTAREGGRVIRALSDAVDTFPAIRAGDRLDVVGELHSDGWKGRRDVILRVRDLRPHAEASENIIPSFNY